LIIRNLVIQVKRDFLTLFAIDSYDSAPRGNSLAQFLLITRTRRSGCFSWPDANLSVAMKTTLRYGVDSSLTLELSDEQLISTCGTPPSEPIADVASAVDRALAEPIEFPTLASAVLPGDKVAVALAEMVPQAAVIVARLVAALISVGVDPADIALVRAPSDDASSDDLLSLLPDDVRDSIVTTLHDPSDRGAMGYVAAAANGDPIYINRAIYDADLAITIGTLRLESSLGNHGIYSGVFPTFSDTATLNRYRSLRACEPKEHERLCKAADEAGWLVGTPFTIQVVPGPGDTILRILAGETRAVFREGARQCDETWSQAIPRRADLVIGTIAGRQQQTWENVARALADAAHSVREGGAIAICTDLANEPGDALKRVAGADDPGAALGAIGKYKPRDLPAAAEIVRALDRGKVYLLSRLNEELVENLGLLPVEASQLSRLASRYDSCIVLENAQYAIAHTADEADRPSRALEHRGHS
jgi:nickel-dependent lactate racemase